MQSKQALVFDSGIGGLSICREIIAAYPTLKVHYLSDNEAFPYGGKSRDELIARALKVIDCALAQISPDIIVIACNTASTVVLPALRERVAIPVVGVVPAIKTAAARTRSGTIGLLATPGTVSREYTQALIDEHAAQHRVIAVGSSELVEIIEAHIYGAALDLHRIESILAEFDLQPGAGQIDTVVLGCTHFPLIRDTLAQLREHWGWVDSGAAIAARVADLLSLPAASNVLGEAGPNHQAWFTREKPPASARPLQRQLTSLGFCHAAQLSI